MLIFGSLYNIYLSPQEFLEKFSNENIIVGGIFINPTHKPELLIYRNKENNHLLIFENFLLERRCRVTLPIHVYEITEDVLDEETYQGITSSVETKVLQFS
jgi:hypothetical protein